MNNLRVSSKTMDCRYASLPAGSTPSVPAWHELTTAFANAAQCGLGQSWRAEVEPSFRPAQVFTAWTPDALWVWAKMRDDDIFNAATALNQATCGLGDVFEMFLWDERRPEYFELHVTPENQHLQLRIERDDSIRLDESQIFYLPDAALFQSRTRLSSSGWDVLTRVPSELITGGAPLQAGASWRFSFSRYDFTCGVREPVLSSSSRHAIPDFHRRHEWGRLHFV